MDTKRICAGCQKPVEADAPDGLCPECLLKAGLGTGVDLGPDSQGKTSRASFVAPSVQEMGRLFPQCEILGFIGQGGMGAVYRARQKELDRVVALKILPPDIGSDPAFADRFTREARALAKLNHSGIVTLYEFGRADGLFFFLMEFVDGVNLRQLLQGRRLSPREALAIVPQICDALQYAHDQGIVHRDIKPENILLDRQGRVKVADFGVAKLIGPAKEAVPGAEDVSVSASNLTDASRVMGTPLYMAPEQMEHPREVDHRADIYSLGVVFYQMLTGELPSQRIEPPSRKVQVDVRLDEVVLRALEEKPERRYQQVSQVKTAVETITASADAPAKPTQTVRKGARRYSGLALACLSGVLGTLAWASMPTPPQPLVWSILVAALAGTGLSIPARKTRPGQSGIIIGCLNVAVWLAFAALSLRLPVERPADRGNVTRTATGTLLARLPEGEIELIAIGFHPSINQPWWRPDGSALPTPDWSGPNPKAIPSAAANFKNPRQLVLRWQGAGEPPELLLRQVPDGSPGSATFWIYRDGKKLAGWEGIIQDFAPGQQTCTLRLAIASGPFQPLTDGLPRSSGGSVVERFPATGDFQGKPFTVGKFFERNGKPATTVAWDYFASIPRQRRIRVQDSLKRWYVGELVDTRSAAEGKEWQETYEFDGVSLPDLREVVLETRSSHWIEFRNVMLNPSDASAVQPEGKRILAALQQFEALKAADQTYEADLRRLAGEVRVSSTAPEKAALAAGATSAQPAATAAPTSKPVGEPATYTFGQVIECTLTETSAALLDLDTGQTWGGMGGRHPDMHVFLDVGTDSAGGSHPSLRAHSLYTVRTADWNIKADDFGKVLTPQVVPTNTTVLATPADRLPVTHWFRTGKGTVGILQVLAFTEAPRGVRIRYRFLQPAAASQTPMTGQGAHEGALANGWTRVCAIPSAILDAPETSPTEGALTLWVEGGWLLVKREATNRELEWQVVLARADTASSPPEVIASNAWLEVRFGSHFLREDGGTLRIMREPKTAQSPAWPQPAPGRNWHYLGSGGNGGRNGRLCAWEGENWAWIAGSPENQRWDVWVRLQSCERKGAGWGFTGQQTLGKFFYGEANAQDDGSLFVTERLSLSAARSAVAARKLRQELLGAPAPALDGMEWLNSRAPLSWNDLRGKVVLLEFWGKWCGPCVKRLPEAEALYAKFRHQNLVVLGVHSQNGSAKLAAFLAERKITFPIAVDTGQTAPRYGIELWPTYFLVDRTGKVVWGFSNEPPKESQILELLRE